AHAATPTWQAPVNATGATQACTLDVTVSDAFGHSVAASTTAHVSSVADSTTITSGPSVTPDPVASAQAVSVSAAASDTITRHTVSYEWTASCPNGLGTGSFGDATADSTTWQAPANATGTTQTCTLTLVASDGHGQTAEASVPAHVESIPDVVTITT